jgi:hypothetical protein
MVMIIHFLPHCKGAVFCCQYRDEALGWTTEELWFDSWQGSGIIYLLQSVQFDSEALTASCLVGPWGLSELKRPGSENEH